jgi:conjugative transfer region protein (TIGR03748 family)
MQRLNRQLFIVFLFILVTATAAVGSVTQLGRYLTVQNQATAEQQDLLKQICRRHFAKSIRTVGGAMRHLLRDSGYSLADRADLSCLLNRSLPQVQRDFGPIALQEGLSTLAGNTYQLLVDPMHRLVSFRLKNIYSGNYRLHNDEVGHD